jgi:pyruvate,water dikinase
MIARWFDAFLRGWRQRQARGGKRPVVELFRCFRALLEVNNQILTAMASMNGKLGGSYIFDIQYIRSASRELEDLVHKLIAALDALAPEKYAGLNKAFRTLSADIESELAGHMVIPAAHMVLGFQEITAGDMEAVGAKNAHLAEIRNLLGLNVPYGLAATTRAFQSYLEHNHLNEPIARLEETWRSGRMTVDEASEKIRGLILAGELPGRLRKALNRAAESLRQAMDGQNIGLAVRSSAWGEDGEHSFAGQYLSLLNEPLDQLSDAYRQVVASAYAVSAMEYRRDMGFTENEVFMAVSFQMMIRVRTSGVVYSLSPENPGEDSLVVAGTWGLGAAMVGGRVPADRFIVSRALPHEEISRSIVSKENALRIVLGGGVRIEPVNKKFQNEPCLSAEEIQLLARTAMRLERYFKTPQDIEYAFDDGGQLVILQARPLRIPPPDRSLSSRDLCESLLSYPVLMSGRGEVAQQGIASGPVFIVRKGRPLHECPQGAIVVAPHSSPAFASILRRAAGVITDVGSPVGHMATIAREYRVPALLNTENATKLLTDGQMITLDAEQKVVYSGQVHELCLHDLTSESIEETYEYRLLRRVLKRISPLNLVDPSDRNFTPEGCRTLHDITRFVHEKAVDELLNINYAGTIDSGSLSGQLALAIPMDLMLMDIGGGLRPESSDGGVSVSGRKRRIIEPDQVLSVPMQAFIKGVTCPGVWESTPVPVDFSSFMSSLTRTFPSELADPQYVGQNLSVISDCYAHLSLRLGYHFTMIDCYVSEHVADNYAYFRFAGGVTDTHRRTRRARFLVEVLERHDFLTTIQQDLVVARIKKLDAPKMLRRVCILGLLVAYTRQLDVSMVDDDQIRRHVEAFGLIVNTAV